MTIQIKILKKAVKGAEITPSLRAKKVVELVAKGSLLSKAKILSAAGYSKAVQRVPGKVFDQPYVRRKVDEVIKDFEEIRDKATKALKDKKLNKESVMSLGMLLRNINHDVELLSGRPTERTDEGLDPVERKKLDELLSRNI